MIKIEGRIQKIRIEDSQVETLIKIENLALGTASNAKRRLRN